MRNIPKSLHTVRVLVIVAKLIRNSDRHDAVTNEECVLEAAETLGYGPDCTDTYQLCTAAIVQLGKGFDL